jgi:NAD(P)-dependent dehydrogenase (short-subunit alcohol dehydrogenase family)
MLIHSDAPRNTPSNFVLQSRPSFERGAVFMQIQDHTFLVTGGSSGLGAACVRRLAGAGGRVLIADLNETAGQELAAEVGIQARFMKVNVVEAGDVETAVITATNHFGNLHGVINCAGIAIAAKLLDREGNPHDLDVFSKVIQVNLIGTFNVIRLAAAAMMKGEANEAGERGVIINTASVAAFDGQIGQAAYSASKGGVVAMTLPIARELARYGIRMMTIAPGIFETPMMAGLPEKARQSLGEQVPFPSRLGRPDEYAALAQHIIENQMLNGEVIRLDGAIRMAPK